MNSIPDAETTPEPTKKRFAPDLTILAMMVAALLLNWFAPIWLAPPHMDKTLIFYLLLMVAWIPVFIRKRRNARKRQIAPVILVGTVVMCCTCMTLRPDSAFVFRALDYIECEKSTLENGRIRYTCTRTAFDGPEFNSTMILEGYEGFPIVWKVESDW